MLIVLNEFFSVALLILLNRLAKSFKSTEIQYYVAVFEFQFVCPYHVNPITTMTYFDSEFCSMICKLACVQTFKFLLPANYVLRDCGWFYTGKESEHEL